MQTINGFINFNYAKPQGKAILNKMNSCLGTNNDKQGLFVHKRTYLGNRPLSYTCRGETYTIVYDGKIYDTDKLRHKLSQQKIRLRSTTDEELIVKLFALEGAKCLRQLNGNFAFVIYTHKTNQLFLARDPLGIKPLFYVVQNNQLAFAGKIKALFAHPTILPCVNVDGLRELFGVCPARTPGKTVYKAIREIKPGEYACWQNGKLTTKTYFTFNSHPHHDDTATTIKKLRTMLTKSVQQQATTNQRLGLMLSGGLDSSTITALTPSKHENLKTFSVDYVGNAENFKPTDFSPSRDNYYIDLVAQQYHTAHTYHVLNSNNLCYALHEALVARDYPSMADIDSSLLLFCQALKQDVDVCLSGEFADEIFCGYPWFYRPDTAQATTFPWAINLAVRENTIAKRLRNVLKIKDFVAQSFADAVAEVPLSPLDSPADRQMKTYSHLTMRWFGLNLLERGERMAARYGLDIRMPFTDLKLVEYVYNIPWTMKNYGNQEKGILRSAVSDLLPQQVITRKKCPYPKTVDPIYTALIEQRIRGLLADEEHPVWQIVDIDYVRQVLQDTNPQTTRPWFGQLMQRPQYLAFIYQIAIWLVEYQIKLELPN
ncbi:MAG: asparagine synthase (glutamine-hydrolyzing) [Clostridia bacterium]|nr:asparagine synthase (glutamine-hydrolyzing) [Clostridia bacterium]